MFSTGNRRGAATAGEAVRAARDAEPGAAPAAARSRARRTRRAAGGLRLVHRRVRYARSRAGATLPGGGLTPVSVHTQRGRESGSRPLLFLTCAPPYGRAISEFVP